MNYLDGFSGYGGFHLGFENAGWEFENQYFSEIDKYAIANYSYNFKKSIYAGSIDTICTSGVIKSLDLFTFGWPCQDNSIAGKRKGQSSGTRSGLLFESVKIINHFKPRNFVAENVAGLLTVNKGIDIIKSLEILTYLNESCPQYDIEMQLFNTRWFLPQNRERVFFVGHLRGSGSRQIFPFGEDIERTIQGATKAPVVRCITAGGNSGGLHSGMTLINKKVQIGTWRTHKDGQGFREVKDNICPTIPARARQDGSGQPVIVTHSLQPRSGKGKGGKGHLAKTDQTAYCIDTGNTQAIEFHDEYRRLTPIECERLQGLPDNHTKFGIMNGKVIEISDTQRYKLCGNGVSIPVIYEIASMLKQNIGQ